MPMRTAAAAPAAALALGIAVAALVQLVSIADAFVATSGVMAPSVLPVPRELCCCAAVLRHTFTPDLIEKHVRFAACWFSTLVSIFVCIKFEDNGRGDVLMDALWSRHAFDV